MNEANLESFLGKVRQSWGPLSTQTVDACRLQLESLAKVWRPESSFEEQELYRDAQLGFVLLAYVENEGRYRDPHDHGSGWVIYAVQRGEMEMSTYGRFIDPQGHLSLVRRESYRMRAGDCKVYLPGDIHDTRCVSSSASILRLSSCDLRKEDREGRLTRYSEGNAVS